MATRIHQLYGDSATFDFSPFRGRMGLVFVDGSHAYDYVANDAMRALAMLRPEGGVILFHDYGTVWDDVTRALNDLRRTVPAFGALRHVEGTTLAVLDAR